MKNVALHNLGCKVNSYELDVVQQMLIEKGYQIVPFDEIADIYIINTCTVTNIADKKSRQMIHRAKQKNPEAIVVAIGCYVQTNQDSAAQDESIDLAIGNNQKKDIVKLLEGYLEKREQRTAIIDIAHTKEYEEMRLIKTAEHTRAYIKIQDGCNQFCSYCAIPLARGRVRSRKKDDILQEIKGLVETGYQEFVLTGIHLSSYGIDFDAQEYQGTSYLLDLLEEIQEISGVMRMRLGSLEPRILTQEAANRLAKLDKLCPHFHLSLQSGSDSVLQRMNRHYTTQEFARSVDFLRQAFANPAITTDVIVGFPGETLEEFQETKAFVREIGFYEMHIFKYSKRNNTRAAKMPDQIPEIEKGRRSTELLELEKEMSKSFRRQHIGQRVEVLLEEQKDIGGASYMLGHTRDYVKIGLPKRENLQSNQVVMVQVTEFLTEEILLGE